MDREQPLGQLLARDGSAGDPGIAFDGDLNTGLRLAGNHQIAAVADGTDVMNVSKNGVSFGEDAYATHPSAAASVNSDTQGFRLPRLTNTKRDAIPNPAQGLMVFNQSVDSVDVFDGDDWRVLATRVDIPASSTSPGDKGQFAVSNTYLYVCVTPDNWVRIAVTDGAF